MPSSFSLQSRVAALVPALLCCAALAACGDGAADRPAEAPYTVDIVAPVATAVVYAGLDVELRAAVTPVGDADLGDARLVYDWDFGDGRSVTGGDATVIHTWDASGQRVVSVAARRLDEADRTIDQASVERSIVVFPEADLAIDGLTLTVAQQVTRNEDRFRVSANLLNRGAQAASPFHVGYYLVSPAAANPDATLTADALRALVATGDAIELDRTDFTELGAQPAQALLDNQGLQVPAGVASGEYLVLLFADPDEAVGDSDRANNAAFASRRLVFEATAGAGPDLTVRAIQVTPVLVNVLDAVNVTATFANVGNAFAPPSDYAIYLSANDPALDEGDTLLAEGRVETLPATRSSTVDLRIPFTPPITALGDYWILVAVDTAEEVVEASEANNVTPSARITVTDTEVPGADLVPTAFSARPESTFLGGTVALTMTVANAGTEPVLSQFNCKVYLAAGETLDPNVDALLHSFLFSPLEPAATADETVDAFIPGFIAAATYTAYVACDPTQLVAEADETNNTLAAEQPLVVAAEANVDLVARNFSLSATTIDNGGVTTVSVDVCNDGTNGATPTIVRVHISPDPLFDTTDSILLESRVPPIDAGACVTIRGEVPVRCDTFVSDYTVFASVDAGRQLTELDETNNTTELGTVLRIDGLICSCEPDSYEPNDAPATAGFLNPRIGSYPARTMCDANVDYYLIPMLRDDTVRVTIRFENARGNLDMELFALDFSTVLSRAATDSDIEEVSFIRVPQRGNYLLRVRGRDVTDRNVYDLNLEVSSPSEGTDLVVLGTTVSNAAPVLGESVDVCFNVINLGDTVAGPSLARLYVSADTFVDPLVDALVAEVPMPAIADRSYQCETVRIPESTGGGPRYVAIVADARDDVPGELNESNNVGFSPVFDVNSACFDPLEPNNTVEVPRLLTLAGAPPVEFTGLLVCSDNRDFYEICIGDGDFLAVEVAFDTTQGDVDLKLYDDTGVEVARSEGVAASESVRVDYSLGARCYRAEVYVAGRDRQVEYTMNVDTGRAPDALACSRIEEPNDGFSAAAPLRNYLDDCMAVCPVTDEDYYQVQLTTGTPFQVSIVGTDGGAPPADLRLTLWGPSRNYLANTVRANEALVHTVGLTGRHFLRVRSNGDGPRSQGYCLRVEGIPGIDLVPQSLEVEADVASPGETLRFTFTLANTRNQASVATDYAVYLSTDPVWSTDDVLLREVDIAALEGLTERLEGRRFTLPDTIATSGQHSVILVVDAAERNAEIDERNNIVHVPLWISPRCVPDIAEPNNFPVDAFDAASAEGVPLTSCGGADSDWFYFVSGRPSATISIAFSDAVGDLDLYVYDATLGLLGVSDGVTDDETLTVLTTPGQRYFAEIRQHTDRVVPYELRVD